MAKSLIFDILANDKASSVISGVGKSVDGQAGKWDKWKAAGVVAATAVAAAAVKFGADSIAAFTESETSQAKLTDAYARFPTLADVNIDKLRGLNSELGKKTKYDDDATASGQAVLAGFKLTGAQLEQMTPLLQDYAAKTGKDLPTAAQDLGKAILGQGRALKDIGLNFKDTGSAAGNFDQLMGGLRTQVGGFAEGEGQTAAGKAEILKNQFGELQETVGSKLMPAMSSLVDVGLKVVDWLSENGDKVKLLAIGVGILTVGFGLANLMVAAHGLALAVAAAGGMGSWIAATGLGTAAQWLWNAAMSANPIGLVVLAVGLLVGAIVAIATKTTWFQTIWKVMTDALGAAWQWLWNTILAPVIRFVLGGFASIVDGIGKMLDVLSNIPGFGWAKTAADKMHGAAEKANALAAGIRDIPDSKTIEITARFTSVAANFTQEMAHNLGSRSVPGNAMGTDYWSGGSTWVGENGPEIVNLPRGSQVIPNHKLDMAGGSGNGDVVAAIQALGNRFGAELDRQARTIQAMQRKMA